MNGISSTFGKLSALTGGYLQPLIKQYLNTQDVLEQEHLLVCLGIHAELIPFESHSQGLTTQQREVVTTYIRLVCGANLVDN